MLGRFFRLPRSPRAPVTSAFFAAVSVVAALLGIVACRYAFGIRKTRLAAA